MLWGEPEEGRPHQGSHKLLLCPGNPLQSLGCSTPFLLWEGFHLHDNLSFHSFVTNFTTKATGRAVGVCRSKALMPLPWARPHHHWLPHSSQAATVSRRPRSLRSSVLRSQEPEEAGPAYRFRSALCKQLHTAANKNPSAHSPAASAKVSLAKAPGFLLLNNLSFCIFKQSCQSLKTSFLPG